MKKIVFSIIVFACFIALMASIMLPISAISTDTDPVEYDSTEAEQLDVTDSYYYDRIPERAQWCYNWLKEFYDNVPNNVPDDIHRNITDDCVEYFVDFTYMLPENPTAEDYSALGRDFMIGDLALKADDPLYDCKGRVSGWSPAYPEGEDVCFDLHIRYSNLHSEEATVLVSARIKQIVDTAGEGDRYTRLRKLSSYLINNMFYDQYLFHINERGYDSLSGRGIIYNDSVYGAFTKNIAVCGGFSETVKVLCDELDIPCIIMGNAAHGWNLVQMDDGCWYRVDITNACRVGWDGELPYTLDEYFDQIFLNNNTLATGFGFYDNPYMINVDNKFSVTDFPIHADGQYEYTGDTTDFSYVEVPLEYDFGEPQFKYRVNQDGKTCTIIDYAGKQSGDLIIPEVIDGYIVTAIDPYSFYYCTGFDGKLIIPQSVKSIGRAAFAGCYNLTSLEMTDGLETIGGGLIFSDGYYFCGGAFIGCKGLTEIMLPDLVDEIYKYTFYDCDSLNSVTFGSHVLSIGEEAFGNINTDLVIKAPANSAAQEYAYANNISFEINGSLCDFVDIDGKLEFDNNNHFYTCEHGVRFNYSQHTREQGFSDCGDKCDTCDAQYCGSHGVFAEDIIDLINVSDATCNMPAYTGNIGCIICGKIFEMGEYIGSPTGQHVSVTEDWEFDGSSHYRWCECGAQIDYEPHYGGTATEYELALCEACGVAYGDFAEHVHAAIDIGYYEDKHFNICSCGLWMDEESHYGGTATTTQRARCVVCGVEYGDFAIDSPENNTEAPENNTEPPENNTEAPENNTEPPEKNTEKIENNTGGPDSNIKEPDSNNSAINAGLAGGCGSSVGVGLISLVTSLAAGHVILKKKKEN